MVEEISVRVLVDPLGRMDRANAAKFLQVTPKTMANWASKGLGPKAFRVAGRTFYMKDDVEAFGRGETPQAA